MARLSVFFLLLFSLANAARALPFRFIFPQTSLGPENLAVIINDSDPLSRRIAAYYQKRRHIPPENMIHIQFRPHMRVMSAEEFQRIKKQVDAETPPQVQAYALTWVAPFRVGCMSITSAFAFGFNKAYCASHMCGRSKTSTYFDSPSTAPYTDLKIRPTMSIAARNFNDAKALIDRGVAADHTYPAGTGYLVSTRDKSRNVRAVEYPSIVKTFGNIVDLTIVMKNFIQNKNDVLFYFTGLPKVPGLNTLHFVPGAIADHLTSSGGQLIGTVQMSSLRWLEAGATGSYGSVVEPCNFPEKFPDPKLAIYWYLQGNSLIEAYWKSVRWPGQGIFIGEPLADPYGGYSVNLVDDKILIRTQALLPGEYALESSKSLVGPYHADPDVAFVHFGMNELQFPYTGKPVYRLMRIH